MESFQIRVPDDVIADLRTRLGKTRLPEATPGPPWSAGTDVGFLARLVDHWATRYDWRHHEAELNRLPHYTAVVADARVHFIHVRVDTPGSPPVILSHGWPYSFIEMLPAIPHLTRGPAGCDVVVPSLPGFGFSDPLEVAFTGRNVAEVWHSLMTEVLGYERFVTYGEDVGAEVSDWLAALHPGSVAGLHTSHAAFPPPGRRGDLTAEEQEFVAWLSAQWEGETAYSALQSSKPDTLASALNDSPAGLLAWLVEKFRTWSHLDGDLEEVWSHEEILTTTTLYWVTETIGASFRPYFQGDDEALPMIDVPVGVSVQWGERGFPRPYAERSYRDIRFWNDLPRGGHFTVKQTPELVAADLRAFLATL